MSRDGKAAFGEQEPRSMASALRCAIYTRKSTEEGLNQDFNTLEAQRESAEAYIRSQLHAGWTVLAERYDDGGYTGANLERPALRRLLADIAADKIDCVLARHYCFTDEELDFIINYDIKYRMGREAELDDE